MAPDPVHIKAQRAGHRQRLKTRFWESGIESLKDYEIIELLLMLAIRQKDVKPLAKMLLKRFSTFQSVLDAPLEDLLEVKGIGSHSALLIKLVRSMSDYYLAQKPLHEDIVSSPADLLRHCRSSMSHLPNEQFRVIYLNAKNRILSSEILQDGTVDQTAVYPRKVMARALSIHAVSMIFVHNHPSGDPQPSDHDIKLTRTLLKAAGALGLCAHDHIIVAKQGYFSFKEQGLL